MKQIYYFSDLPYEVQLKPMYIKHNKTLKSAEKMELLGPWDARKDIVVSSPGFLFCADQRPDA